MHHDQDFPSSLLCNYLHSPVIFATVTADRFMASILKKTSKINLSLLRSSLKLIILQHNVKREMWLDLLWEVSFLTCVRMLWIKKNWGRCVSIVTKHTATKWWDVLSVQSLVERVCLYFHGFENSVIYTKCKLSLVIQHKSVCLTVCRTWKIV